MFCILLSLFCRVSSLVLFSCLLHGFLQVSNLNNLFLKFHRQNFYEFLYFLPYLFLSFCYTFVLLLSYFSLCNIFPDFYNTFLVLVFTFNVVSQSFRQDSYVFFLDCLNLYPFTFNFRFLLFLLYLFFSFVSDFLNPLLSS